MTRFHRYAPSDDEHVLGYETGPTFTNYGAESIEDGYRFIWDDRDYMQADLGAQADPLTTLTLQCWVRDWGSPDGVTDYFVSLFRQDDPGGTRLCLYAKVVEEPSSQSRIAAAWTVAGVTVGYLTWYGTDVYDLLSGSDPWHIAVVMDNLTIFRLFVDGVQRYFDTTGLLALPAANYSLKLGGYPNATWGDASLVLDEVRLSKAARYDENFTPVRYWAGDILKQDTDLVRLVSRDSALVRTLSREAELWR